MANVIKIKNGLESAIEGVSVSSGELLIAWNEDRSSARMYIGNSRGEKILCEAASNDLSKASFNLDESYTYTGYNITPVVVTLNGNTLTEGTDYTIEYINNINAGTAGVTVTGAGDYTGSKTASFVIAPKNLDSVTVSAGTEYYSPFHDGAYMPTPSARFTTKNNEGRNVTKYLTRNTDYEVVRYWDNTQAGTGKVEVRAVSSNYTGNKVVYFTIYPVMLSDWASDEWYDWAANNEAIDQGEDPLYWTYLERDLYGWGYYTGEKIEPTINYMEYGEWDWENERYNTYTLVKGVDYIVYYEDGDDGISTGNHKIYIEGIGNFTDVYEGEFQISKPSISRASAVAIPDQTYTGKEIKPKPVLTYNGRTLVEGEDYTLTYTNNIAAASQSSQYSYPYVTVTGTGIFAGTRTLKFTILPAQVNPSLVEIGGIEDRTYTGSSHTPVPTVTYDGTQLTYNTHYTVTWSDNTDAGTAEITITGRGSYTGQFGTTTFNINPYDISDGVKYIDWILNYDGGTCRYDESVSYVTPSHDMSSKVYVDYTGSEVKPAPRLRFAARPYQDMTNDTDYTLDYENNINKGTATLIINGKGNYTGSYDIKFSIISKTDISAGTLYISELGYGDNSYYNKNYSYYSSSYYTNRGYLGRSDSELRSNTYHFDGKSLWCRTYMLLNGEKKGYNIYSPYYPLRPGTYAITVLGCGKYKGSASTTITILVPTVNSGFSDMSVWPIKEETTKYTNGWLKLNEIGIAGKDGWGAIPNVTFVMNKGTTDEFALVRGVDYELYNNGYKVGTYDGRCEAGEHLIFVQGLAPLNNSRSYFWFEVKDE